VDTGRWLAARRVLILFHGDLQSRQPAGGRNT